MSTTREVIADELERQIMEDFRNPTLGAPDVDGKIQRDLMLARADRIIAIIQDRILEIVHSTGGES